MRRGWRWGGGGGGQPLWKMAGVNRGEFNTLQNSMREPLWYSFFSFSPLTSMGIVFQRKILVWDVWENDLNLAKMRVNDPLEILIHFDEILIHFFLRPCLLLRLSPFLLLLHSVEGLEISFPTTPHNIKKAWPCDRIFWDFTRDSD